MRSLRYNRSEDVRLRSRSNKILYEKDHVLEILFTLAEVEGEDVSVNDLIEWAKLHEYKGMFLEYLDLPFRVMIAKIRNDPNWREVLIRIAQKIIERELSE